MTSYNDSDVVTIKLDKDNYVKVHLYGATVISWINCGVEKIFVSKQSLFDNKKAIRGGIPVVFPNFGPWDLGPQHGFARISRWTVEKDPSVSDGIASAVFQLCDGEATRAMWDKSFKLVYTISVDGASMTTHMDITNTGSSEFDFTFLLHTYLQLEDVEKTSITNLQGKDYVDKLKNGQLFTEDRDRVVITEGYDRVYGNTMDYHDVVEANGTGVRITKNNLPDTVVWNPWEKAKGMSDFGDEEFPYMVCVEAGYVNHRRLLAPSKTFSCGQVISKM